MIRSVDKKKSEVRFTLSLSHTSAIAGITKRHNINLSVSAGCFAPEERYAVGAVAAKWKV